MRLLLCGGGTAGHINPAIAIAEELKKQIPNSEVLFIGREGGRENALIEKSGFNYKTIPIEGLKRSVSADNLRRIIAALKARGLAERIIKDFKPDVILGTGGYVCWPVITAGARLGIPRAIHESNAVPGITTKLVASSCQKVFINRESTAEYFSQKTKTVAVGNPILQDFSKVSRTEARRKMGVRPNEIFILSFGGSIGAKKINEVMTRVMDMHSSKTANIRHLHATGKRYYNIEQKKYFEKSLGGCRIVPFISNMPIALTAADIVICRAGAMTVSELCAVGVASVLIPSPNVSNDHQYKNAKYLKDQGASYLIEEKELDENRLIELIISLENDENGRKNKAKTIRQLHAPDAAKRIVDELILMQKQP